MHLEHDHDGAHTSHHSDDHRHALRGHNRVERPAQWQTPHRPPGEQHAGEASPVQDLDLVAASFAEGFATCSDPTSFLRLAGIPFVGVDAAGRRLHLLRIELENFTDVGAVVPLLGGQGVRYAPLPGRLVSRRRQLRFVYHDGAQIVRLDFAAARALADRSDQ
jgi:hypothetical protein